MVRFPNGRDFGATQSSTSKSIGAHQADGDWSDFYMDSATVKCDIVKTGNAMYDNATVGTDEAYNVECDIIETGNAKHDYTITSNVKTDPVAIANIDPQ